MSSSTASEITPPLTHLRVQRLVDGVRRHLLALSVFSFFINLLTLSVPMFLLQVYDRVIPNHSQESLWVLALVCVLGIAAMAMLEWIRQAILDSFASWGETLLGPELLNSALLRAVRRGEPSISILKDASRLSRFASSGAVITAMDAPWAPLFLVAITLLHPALGAVVLAGGVVLVVLAVLHERLIRPRVEHADTLSHTADDAAQGYLNNAEVIHAMGMHPAVAGRWERLNNVKLAEERRIAATTNHFQTAARFTRFVLQIGMVATATLLVISGELTAGAIIASILLLRRAIAPLESCIQSWKAAVEAKSAWSRIREYMGKVSTPSTEPMPVPNGPLSGRNLSYKFAGAERSLFSKVDFDFQPGRSIAIVGDTGSGKSTFARLLVGAKRSPGGMLTLGGFDLSAWHPVQYGRHLGYLPQDVELFEGSIRANISRLEEAPLEVVIEAARLAGAHDMIQRLPGGYDFNVGNAGHRLSGGQRQRVALARAMFGTPA